MTGNNKVWRAPVAGLASIAMLATMGAATATAAPVSETPSGTYEVSYVDANGEKQTLVEVTTGDSIVDAKQGESLAAPVAALGAGDFVGWYYNGAPVDYLAPVTGDMTLTPMYATDTVDIDFSGAADVIGFLPGGVSNKLTLPMNSSLSAALLPTDKADGKIVDQWKVVYPDGVEETVSDLTDVDWTRPDDDITITAAHTVAAVTDVYSASGDVYALNAYADGDKDDTLKVDAVAGSTYATPAAPVAATGEQYTTYANWKTGTGTSTSTVAIGADVTAADTATTYTLDGSATYYFVKFDSEGGSQVAGQYVKSGGYASAPAENPTRDGYSFRGWVTASNGETAFDFNTTKIEATGTTVHAAWKAEEAAAVELKVTFEDAEYNGAHEAESIVISSDELLSGQTPEWTRDGYVLAGWSANGSAPVLDLETTTAGALNGRKDATLKAVWVAITTDVAKAALQYVTAADEGLFTPASWEVFEDELAAAQEKYDDAVASTVGQIDAVTSAEIVTDLNKAWSGLQFKNASSADTTTNVHRLRKGDEHFYSDDVTEIAFLTSTLFTSGGWIDEGNLLYGISEGAEKLADFSAAVEAAYEGDENKDARDQVLAELTAAATPIVNLVNRVYNTVSGDHVWTVDANEYEVLTGQAQWVGEGSAFAVPAYNGLRTVSRLYKDNRHLLSTDSNEVKVLSEQQGWSDEGTAFLAY